MPIALNVTHTTAADGTFSSAGAVEWNAAHTTGWTGLTANALVYSDGTDLKQSANLTFDENNLTIGSAIRVGAGTKTAPSISFTGDSNSGFYSRSDGFVTWAIEGLAEYEATSTNFNLAQANTLGWANIESDGADTGISRIGVATLAIGNGTGNSFAGSLKLTSAIAAGVAIASLNASPTTGEVQSVTDALAPALGATVAAGGAAKALVWYNGANWTVIGI